ncbi:hypothetical protein D0868_12318 [Hortaea werneckii]|nr:hypothetical protein D0868_12318 [Hortaea werneckii]
MDDYYCQCTEGRQQILDSGVGCLCQSTCSTTELLAVLQEVNKLCKSALQAKGESYTAPDVGLEACAGGAAGSSSSSSSDSSTTGMASDSATATSTSTSSSSSSSTDGDASAEQEEDGSGESEESGAEGLRKVYQGAVVIGALAVGVAIL